jgi:cysteine desulfurase
VDAVEAVVVNGGGAERLANTLNLAFSGVEAEGIVLGLDLAGIAVSSGSACSAGTSAPSHVLLAMGLEPRLAAAAVRFSLGKDTTEAEVDRVVEVLPPLVARLRAMSMLV